MSEDRKKILCVGMCVLDIIHTCTEYPKEDTDKRCLRGDWQRGGNASNNVTVLRQFKVECEFLGVMSKSPAFKILHDDCVDRGIEIANCPTVDQNPPFSSVILNQLNGSRTIIHSNQNFPILRFEHFRQIDLSCYRWIHFEARNPTETGQMIEMIQKFNKKEPKHKRIIISLDLEKLREEVLDLIHDVDLIIMGKDFAAWQNWCNAEEAVKGLRNKTNTSKIIICAWGSSGAGILEQNDEYHFIPATPQDLIVDSLGAGDTFCASIIYAMSEYQSTVTKAVQFAHKMAAFKLGHYGYDQIGSVYQQIWDNLS